MFTKLHLKVRWQTVAWVLFLLTVASLAVVTKSLDFRSYQYLLDGDPYFHANVIRYIAEHWQFPATVPNQIPTTGIFYPMGFHLVFALVSKVSGFSEFQLLRWGGPVIAGLLTVSMFFLARRLSKRAIFCISATLLTALLPIFIQRLSITLPENLFLLAVVWALYISTYVFQRPTFLNVVLLSAVAGLGLFFHFSGYILGVLPIIGWSYFLWLKIWHRKFWQFLLFAAILAGGFWLVLYLRPELWQTVESFSNRAVANPEFMPHPAYAEWLDVYGWLPLNFMYVGMFFVLRAKSRRWWGIWLWGAASLAFIDLLPRFNLYNLLPFRAFPYFAFALIPIAAYGIDRVSTKYRWVFPVVVLGLFLSLPIRPAGWDKDITPYEYQAMRQLGQVVESRSQQHPLIITQPINGRPITYFTRIDTISDSAVDMLLATNIDKFRSIASTIGAYDEFYVYISKYKLGPEYNRGWVRPWATANLNQRLFWDTAYFEDIYENPDAKIVRLRSLN